MKVAIPIHGTRVSPLFDTAGRALVVGLIDGRETSREIIPLSSLHMSARVTHLANEGVEVLICGGISRSLAELVEGAGIRLVPWIAGEVEEVLSAFGSGDLAAPRFLMPGCGRGNRIGRRSRGGWNASCRYGVEKQTGIGEGS